ncbi:MAG TPA: SusC/RagA family TonB-linked outer membrane protein, partial [Puia sp.]
GYQFQEAMFPSTNNKKYNLALNLDAQATATTKISFNINGRSQNSQYPAIAPGRVFELLQYVNTRRGALFFTNGKPGDKIPATIYGSGYEKINTLALYSQLSIEQDLPFIPGLKAKGTVAYDPSNGLDKLWRIPTHITSIVDTSQHPYVFKDAIFDQAQASLNETNRQSYQLTYQASLNYVKSFRNNNITALALFEAKSNDSLYLAASRRNYNVNIDEIDLGSSSQADMTTNGSSSATRQLGLLYRVTYNYSQKYFFEASGRYDGSYYFAPGKQFGFFPAFSAGWRLSQENFLKDISWIDNLKIRGSYGEVGALAGAPFQYLSTYSVYGPAYVLGGQAVQAASERAESNPNITWERAKKTDIGLDLSLWNGLLTLEADYFYEKRSNMLVSPNVIVPSEYGIGLSQVNGGIMENKGIDFSIGSAYSISKDFQISLQGNFTYARNTLLKVFETSATYDNPNRRITGKPLGTQFGFHAVGYFQEADFNPDGTLKSGIAVQPWGAVNPGDLRYEDINHDGQINNDDLTKIGNSPTPRIIYGISPSVRYKGLSLDLLFQGAADANLYMDRQMQWPFYNSMNAYVANFNSWTPDNPNAKYPRITNAPTTNNSQQSSWWMTNVSYLRLKSATLAYVIPSFIISRIKMQSVRVFLSGQNILTWTKLINYDPENAGAYTNLYPQQKVISAGLNISF